MPPRKVWEGNADLARLTVPVAKLQPHPSNPRKGDVAELIESLRRFGQQRPVLALPDGTLVAGHHLFYAARDLGWTHFAVVRSDLQDREVEAYLLADNRLGQLGTYDQDALAALLQPLKEAEALVGTGFSSNDVSSLLAKVQAKNRDSDATPPVPAQPKSEVGATYELGPHRLLCGDAFTDLDRLIGTDKVSVLFTDPPYGMGLDTEFSGMHGANEFGGGGHDYAPVIGDDGPFDPTPLLEQYAKVKEQFWFGADYYREHIPPGGSWIVWDKRHNDAGSDLDRVLGAAFELCWSKKPHKREIARITWTGHHGMGADDTSKRVHPTQKPTALASWILDRYSREGQVVLDPFAGAGFTLIACEQLGRKALLAELDPGYCDVIRRRYADYVGDPRLAP